MISLKIRTTVDIPTSAAAAWQVFGEEFATWDSWAPGIDTSTLEGPLAQGVVRENVTPSLGTVRQTLTKFDRDERALAYEMIEGLPPFLGELRNDWKLEAVTPELSRLSGEAIFGIRDAAAPKASMIEQKMTQTLNGFAAAFRSRMTNGA